MEAVDHYNHAQAKIISSYHPTGTDYKSLACFLSRNIGNNRFADMESCN